MTNNTQTAHCFPVNLFHLKRAIDLGFTEIEVKNIFDEIYTRSSWEAIFTMIAQQGQLVKLDFDIECVKASIPIPQDKIV